MRPIRTETGAAQGVRHSRGSLDARKHQAETDQKLTEIIEGQVQDAQALLRGLAERVQDQDYVADQEGQRADEEDRGVCGRAEDQAACRDACHDHDSTDIEHAEDLERRLRGDLPENEVQRRRGQDNARDQTRCEVFALGNERGEVGDVA